MCSRVNESVSMNLSQGDRMSEELFFNKIVFNHFSPTFASMPHLSSYDKDLCNLEVFQLQAGVANVHEFQKRKMSNIC